MLYNFLGQKASIKYIIEVKHIVNCVYQVPYTVSFCISAHLTCVSLMFTILIQIDIEPLIAKYLVKHA